MAATAQVGEIWEVRLRGKVEQQDCINVLHFESLTLDPDVVLHLLQAIASCVITHLIPGMASTYTFNSVDAKRIAPTEGPVVEWFPDANNTLQGQSAGDALPSFSSCLVSKHTTRAGRFGRGRMFLPPPPEGATTASSIIPTSNYWIQIAAFLACVVTKFMSPNELPAAGTWFIGVWSKGRKARAATATRPALAAVEPGFARMTNMVARPLIKTQNSRKIGHGS